MKKILIFMVAFLMFVPFLQAEAVVSVKGYYRKDGTYVAPHYRSDPDGIKSNNWSYPGNTNPYTGKTAGGSVSSYLNNYSSGSNYSSSLYSPTYLPTYTPSYYYTPSYTTSYTPTYTPTYTGYTSSSYQKVSGGYKSYGVLFCDSGYYESGESCKKAPKNSMAIGSTFYCDYGYEKKGSSCVDIDTVKKQEDKKLQKSKDRCDKKGNIWYDDKCVTPLKLCRLAFGTNSVHSSGTTLEDVKCSCKTGYVFDEGGKGKCVKSK